MLKRGDLTHKYGDILGIYNQLYYLIFEIVQWDSPQSLDDGMPHFQTPFQRMSMVETEHKTQHSNHRNPSFLGSH